jgi:hypothetical protein
MLLIYKRRDCKPSRRKISSMTREMFGGKWLVNMSVELALLVASRGKIGRA